MYSRSPSGVDSGGRDSYESSDREYEEDRTKPADGIRYSHLDSAVDEHIACAPPLDQGPSVLQMAFLHLMARKVVEATANQPEVLKQLNAGIRANKR